MAAQIKPKASISILFVEDDEVVLELQSAILSIKFPDAAFYTAVNGRLGLELFKIHMPDIVITDINMSEMCGVQMSHAIRILKPATKFIAITGRSEKSLIQNSNDLEFKFDHIIVKPVVLSELFAVVAQCIGEIEQEVS